ncbi:RNA polymerase subunit sigma, partial [Salibacteraceae bacterium]|nr:RNA polymerase subunit sigma [Salibacteraceae bacterium]
MRQLKIAATFTDRNNLTLDKYLNEVSREGMITQEEEVELTKRIREGDSLALDRMVRANLRFVISVAKQYQGQGMP